MTFMRGLFRYFMKAALISSSCSTDGRNRLRLVGRIVIFSELVQNNARAVVQLHLVIGSFIVIRFDILIRRNEVEVMDRIEMAFGVFEALGRSLVVVESDAWADDIQDSAAPMSESALDQGCQLLAIAGKASSHISRTQRDRELRHIDGRDIVNLSAFHDGPDIGRGGELSLSQSIDTVVLDDVGDIHIAAHHMTEIPQADSRRVAITRHADRVESMVGQISTGGDG